LKRLVLSAISIFIVVALALFFIKKPVVQEIRISTNPWVGFTPFMYAEQKGWLKDTRFKFVWTVGLDENSKLYERGLTQGFTATQYELFNFKNRDQIKPFFLIDKSYGADVILSNRSIDEIKNSEDKIEAHYELISVNEDMFKAFIAKYNIQKERFTIKNCDQGKMSSFVGSGSPTLLISYEPYVTALTKKGFKRIASTKELDNIQVIDALFMEESAGVAAKKDIVKLKAAFDKAVKALQNDPKEFYSSIGGYLENQSYEEFMSSTKGIEWLNVNPPSKTVEYLKTQGIGVDRLMR